VVPAHKAVRELGIFSTQACRAAEFFGRSGANGFGQGNRPQRICDSAADASISSVDGRCTGNHRLSPIGQEEPVIGRSCLRSRLDLLLKCALEDRKMIGLLFILLGSGAT
jgi:hypothetical protein